MKPTAFGINEALATGFAWVPDTPTFKPLGPASSDQKHNLRVMRSFTLLYDITRSDVMIAEGVEMLVENWGRFPLLFTCWIHFETSLRVFIHSRHASRFRMLWREMGLRSRRVNR